jgi:hypothetical protein
MELELTTFDLPLAIDNARTFMRERATKHGITVEVEIDERANRNGEQRPRQYGSTHGHPDECTDL